MGVPNLLSPAPGSDSMGLDLAHRPGLLTNGIELRHKARIRQRLCFEFTKRRARAATRDFYGTVNPRTDFARASGLRSKPAYQEVYLPLRRAKSILFCVASAVFAKWGSFCRSPSRWSARCDCRHRGHLAGLLRLRTSHPTMGR